MVSGVTKTEAMSMASIVFTAMFQQLLEKGRVILPFGNMVMGVTPKAKYPLRIKLYMSTPEAAFLSTGEVEVPSPLMACLLPEHHEILGEYQKKAYAYQQEKINDAIQKNSSPELQVD